MEIITEISKGLLTIQINRPKRKNSFTNAMYLAIGDAFREAYLNAHVKAVLVKGHPDCFSAGNDLGDFTGQPPSGQDAPVFRFLRLLNTFPKPVVAQVEGLAIGIGTTMLLHCDWVYAADTAKFSVPFTKLGLCPEAASSYILPKLAGHQRAAEMLLLGDMFTASQAYDYGIVSAVKTAQELEAHVNQQCEKLLALPIESLLVTKRLMKSQDAKVLANKLKEEGDIFVSMLSKAPAQEAFSAFAEKRTPDFKQFESSYGK